MGKGGPIGLQVKGAVSRPFMMMWDRVYQKMFKNAGLKMRLYERYVDNSNQAADVPPPGSKYDKASRKVVYDGDEHANRIDECG